MGIFIKPYNMKRKKKNIINWLEILPEDLWNRAVCYVHEADDEDIECSTLNEALTAVAFNWNTEEGRLFWIYLADTYAMFKKHRLITETDWELLEEIKAKRNQNLTLDSLLMDGEVLTDKQTAPYDGDYKRRPIPTYRNMIKRKVKYSK